MTPGQEVNNGSGWITKSVCAEKVKRIDGEIESVKNTANHNSERIDKIHVLLISTLASSVFSLLGIIAILAKSLS